MNFLWLWNPDMYTSTIQFIKTVIYGNSFRNKGEWIDLSGVLCLPVPDGAALGIEIDAHLHYGQS